MPDPCLRNIICWSGLGFLSAVWVVALLVVFGVIPG